MLKQNNKILLICYSFPPHPGIGGRRWAKFSKFLVLKGYDITVVSAENFQDHVSFWDKDVMKDKLKLIQVKFTFQRILKHPKSFIDKVFRKGILFFISKTKYNPSIITSLPNKAIWKQVDDIIKSQNIKKVIVSGDPYLFYYACLLKKKTNFDLVLDYRDLWNDHTFYKKNVLLKEKQKLFFEYAENYAVNNCNKIIFVDDYLQSIIKKRITNNNISTYIIHNGFDKNDLIGGYKHENTGNVIDIFFAGSISSDLNASLMNFIFAYRELLQSRKDLFDKFSISIYGEIDTDLVKEIKNLKLNTVTIDNNGLDIDKYYRKLSKIDVGIVILSEEYKNSFITKFSDYLFYDKFILSIGFKGHFDSYIEERNIGLGFDGSNPEDFFEKLIQKIKISSAVTNEEKRRFDLSLITQKLIKEVIEN